MKNFLVVMLLPFVLIGSASAASFRDVASNHTSLTAIEFMRSKGIISGYGDGTFRPDAPVNRAEFVKMVMGATMNASDVQSCTDVTAFKDVQRNDWFSTFLCAAHERGVIDGYSDGTFQGMRTMNFAEAAKIVVEAAGIEHRSYAFVWYRPYIDALRLLQAVPPSLNDPSHLMTRAEIAEILYRLRDVLDIDTQSSSRESWQSGTTTRTITVDGRKRMYIVHIPERMESQAALVLAFHGGHTSAEMMQTMTGFDTKADQKKFIVVYPQGIDDSWNDGRGTTAAAKQNINDVNFVRALIHSLQKDFPIDAGRIYATGASNGGIFTHLLGCEMADTFAAIAPVIGSIATNKQGSCAPSEPISVVMIQGTDDPYIPYDGGEEGWKSGKGEGGQVASAMDTLALWVAKNGCLATTTRDLKPTVSDGTSVTVMDSPSCRKGTQTSLYRVNGGGHLWHPKSPGALVEFFIKPGVSSKNIDTSQVIVDFFLLHRK